MQGKTSQGEERVAYFGAGRKESSVGVYRAVLALLCSAALIQSVPVQAADAQPGLGLHLADCALGKAKVPARCGTFGVYENRDAESGRIIQLHLIVVPAKTPAHRAIAEIGGGPGEAATEFAQPLVDGEFGPAQVQLRDTYDYIFMDDRGMGKSNPFPCDFAPAGNPAAYFGHLFPPALVSGCRTKSEATHDIALYNTNNAVDDLDDIRAALGYDKIVLDGGSYGTFFSLVYMRRHPQHVESAILDAVAPPGFQPIPGEPAGAQQALDQLFSNCRSDASCSAHYPKFEQHFKALLSRFDSGPLPVTVMNRATKRVQTVELSKEVFVDNLRHILYNAFGAAYVPYVVERAYAKDYAPLGRMMQTVIVGFATDINDGAYLAYSCAEFMPFLSPAQLQYAQTHSFAGDLRIRAQQRACATWAVPAMPASFNDPVQSDAPVLMLLGAEDPATPAKYGLAALKYLPNGRAVLVKGFGHGEDTACTAKLRVQFVRAQSAKGLDVDGCTASFKLPPFATSMKGWP